MSIRLQIILLVCLVVVFAALVNQVRKKKLELKYILSWLLLDVILIILTIFPQLLVMMSNGLGITSPINMLFFCGFVFSLVIIYTLTVALSNMSNRIRDLAQKIALMEKGDRDAE